MDLGLREGGWSPGGPSQLYSIPTGRAQGSSLGWTARRETCSPFHPASCSCLSLVSLSLMAASLGPCCQVFQADRLMNLLLLNDRKKRNLIGSQQWERVASGSGLQGHWVTDELGPEEGKDSRRALHRPPEEEDRQKPRNRKSRDLPLRYSFLPLGSAS